VASWFLFNASPDLRAQIEGSRFLHARGGTRSFLPRLRRLLNGSFSTPSNALRAEGFLIGVQSKLDARGSATLSENFR